MLALNQDVPFNHCAACEEEMFGERVTLGLKPDDAQDGPVTVHVQICADCAKAAADEAIQSWMQ